MTATTSTPITRSITTFVAAHLSMLLLTLAVIAGLIARFSILLPRDFPIVDGGMFYTMINDLRAAHYALPAFTSYNHLPYAYSPLAFYFTALLTDLTGVSPLVYVWILPTVFNLLTILVVFMLGGALLDSELKGSVAALVYAINPAGFEWYIMGGGLTRAPGYLFALLTLYCAYRMYTCRRWRYVVLTALCGAISTLSHMQQGYFAAFSVVVLFLFYGLHRKGIIQSVVVTVGVVVLTFPWWGAVIAMHGASLFQYAFASSSGGSPLIATATRIDLFGEPTAYYLNFIPLMGLAVCLVNRRWVLPAWFAANLFISIRGAEVRGGAIMALLTAVTVMNALVPFVLALWRRGSTSGVGTWRALSAPENQPLPTDSESPSPLRRWWKPVAVVALTVPLSIYTISSPSNTQMQNWDRYRFYALAQADRDAMAWVAQYTLPTCRFVTVTIGGTSRDVPGEWFPALAQRQNLTTPQGTEWLPPPAWDRYRQARVALNQCANQDVSCVEAWREQFADFTHLYIESPGRTGCCGSLRQSLRQSSGYNLIYSKDGVDIFARRDSPCAVESTVSVP